MLAQPVVSEMLNARAEMVFRRPYGQPAIVATVTVTQMYEHRNVTYFICKPDVPYLTERSMSEFEFIKGLIRYLPRVEKAAA